MVRTLANRVRAPLSDLEKGPLLETFLLHELRSAMLYLNTGGEFSYWRTPAGVEIDFIWTHGDTAVAIEIKSSTAWHRKESSALHRAVEDKLVSRACGVFLGGKDLREGRVRIHALSNFLKRLWGGEILREGTD